MANVVSFINYKGGVGKTTLAVEISAALYWHYGFRVLLADLDPQTNATFYLITENEWYNWQQTKGSLKSIFDNYAKKVPFVVSGCASDKNYKEQVKKCAEEFFDKL